MNTIPHEGSAVGLPIHGVFSISARESRSLSARPHHACRTGYGSWIMGPVGPVTGAAFAMAVLWFSLAAVSVIVFVVAFSLSSTRVLKVPARIVAFVSGLAFLVFAELYGSTGQEDVAGLSPATDPPSSERRQP
jgi:hypothetical protein